MKGYIRVCKKDGGFSLVELAIVVAVIAALASLAVPAVNDWVPNYRLKKAASALYSTLQNARLEAVRSNSARRLVFNTGANTYQVWSDPDMIWGTADDIAVSPPVVLPTFGSNIGFGWGDATNAAPAGGALPGGPVNFAGNAAVFTARGMLNPPSGYVYLQNDQNSCCAIEALTSGAIHIYKWFSASGNWR